MNEETLQLIEELAFCNLSEKQIFLITEADPKDKDVREAIAKGYAKSEAKINSSIMRLAEAGSAAAQQMALNLIHKRKIKL